MGIREDLDSYFRLEELIHAYFGYAGGWVTLPLQDCRGHSWFLLENGSGGGRYVYSPQPMTAEGISDGNLLYSGSIYTLHFLHRWVYPAPELTLVCTNPRTDGNRYLSVFENSLEVKDETLQRLYLEHWGPVP